MNLQKPSTLLTPLLAAAAFGISSATAAVSTLTFSGGAGTSGFDQYTGTAGSGWAGAWGTNSAFASSGGTATVINTSPLNGGGDYLNVTAANGTAGALVYRLNRTWSTAGFDFSAGVKFEFDLRVSNIIVSGSNQQIGIQASSGTEASPTGTSGNTSWAFASSGSGWSASNNGTFSSLLLNGTGAATGVIAANSDWHFTVTTNAANTSYTASVYNLASPGSVYSLSGLALRNTSTASLTILNFLDNVTANKTGGFAVDNIAITSLASPIPEPGTYSLLAGGACLAFGYLRSSRRRRA